MVLLLSLLSAILDNAIAGNTRQVEITALLLAFYAIFVIYGMFSFRYLEIKSVDDDKSC